MTEISGAFRALRAQPRFTAVAVLTLAAGIGACAALFSVYDQLVLRPLTVPAPSTLVAILNNNPQLPVPVASVSWPRYEQIRDHATSFASVGISAFDSFTITGDGDPLQLTGLRASASFLPTLGVALARGRNFTVEEDQPNGPAVCLISYEFWQSRFAGRESIVGATIRLNEQPWQVVGVTPPRLTPPFRQVQIFAPRVFEVAGLTAAQVQGGAGYAQPLARLKPGVTLEAAARELEAISLAYREQFAARLDARNTSVPQPYVTFLTGGLNPTFRTLLSAVGFVLLIACANVAALFLGRLTSRQKEIAVRQSLGASRARVVRQFLVESLVFSSAGGLLGLVAGQGMLRAIQQLASAQLPPNTTFAYTGLAVVLATGVTLLCALVVGLAPAWQASKAGLAGALNDKVRGSTGRGGRLRGGLIVAEVALSVVLLVGSGMLLLSFVRLQQTPPGFDPAGVASAFISLPATRYATSAQQAEFYAQVVERLRVHPQVTAAAAGIGLPLSGFNPRSPYGVAGRPIPPLSQRPLAQLAIVSEDYFGAIGIRITEGRAFTAGDRQGAPGVCIINESLARRLFPGESPLGKVLLRGPNADIASEVVGVIADVKTLGLNVPAPDEIYYPMRQLGRPAMAILARTAGDPSTLQAVIRAAVTDLDPGRAISFFSTMETNVAQSMGVQRLVASITAAFAGVALLLSAIGLYSVLAYVVSQRTAEIGVRMALGARAGQVIGMIMQGGMRLVALGLVLGLASAAGAAQLIRSLLYQVEPLDPRIYAGVAALYVVVAVLACLIPSLRASRVDPLVALRLE
jgi:predicted permease